MLVLALRINAFVCVFVVVLGFWLVSLRYFFLSAFGFGGVRADWCSVFNAVLHSCFRRLSVAFSAVGDLGLLCGWTVVLWCVVLVYLRCGRCLSCGCVVTWFN